MIHFMFLSASYMCECLTFIDVPLPHMHCVCLFTFRHFFGWYTIALATNITLSVSCFECCSCTCSKLFRMEIHWQLARMENSSSTQWRPLHIRWSLFLLTTNWMCSLRLWRYFTVHWNLFMLCEHCYDSDAKQQLISLFVGIRKETLQLHWRYVIKHPLGLLNSLSLESFFVLWDSSSLETLCQNIWNCPLYIPVYNWSIHQLVHYVTTHYVIIYFGSTSRGADVHLTSVNRCGALQDQTERDYGSCLKIPQKMRMTIGANVGSHLDLRRHHPCTLHRVQLCRAHSAYWE